MQKAGGGIIYRVIVVDNDKTLVQVLAYCLEHEGWHVTALNSGSNALMRVADRPNLWILDADGEEGFNLMRAVREDSNAVGIILTAERERIVDRVLGLELGCDDFVVKPFSPRELILRAKRVLERAEQTTKTLSHLIKMQDYWLDLNRRVAVLDNQPVELTSKEFEALLLFARHRGMVLSRKQIIHHVWGLPTSRC